MLVNTPQYDSGVLQNWLPQEMRLRTHLVVVAPFVEVDETKVKCHDQNEPETRCGLKMGIVPLK